jgi:hypothetical protein
MIRTAMPFGRRLLTRTALGAALALGVTASMAMAPAAFAAGKPSAPKVSFSPAFTKAAADLDKTITEASRTPNAAVQAASAQVTAAKTPEARTAAAAAMDAALGGAKARLAAAGAVATTSGDKLKTGEMTRIVGVLTGDPAVQHDGLVAMLSSGGLAPEITGQVQYLAGITAYQKRDFATAAQYLRQSYDGGYRDRDNLLQSVLVDSYRRTGNNAGALAMAQGEIAAAKAAGVRPSETSIRTALQAAYDGQQNPAAFNLAAQLVQYYPGKSTWNTAINILRTRASPQAQESLDMMRLMQRTDSFNDERDYIEYIQVGTNLGKPKEVLAAIQAGLAAGKLNAANPTVRDAKAASTARQATDQNQGLLASYERDVRAPGVRTATLIGAADSFLTYGQPDKAEAIYGQALSRPDVDAGEAQLRQGIAQFDQGKFAVAAASFAKVTGRRAPVAALWAVLANQKAKPAV